MTPRERAEALVSALLGDLEDAERARDTATIERAFREAVADRTDEIAANIEHHRDRFLSTEGAYQVLAGIVRDLRGQAIRERAKERQ